MAKLSSKKSFTKIGHSKGYMQIQMEEDSNEHTAFVMPNRVLQIQEDALRTGQLSSNAQPHDEEDVAPDQEH